MNANAAQGFTLILHELATNAAKYGALTISSGAVFVEWTIERGPAAPTVTFRWRERGGPPAKAPSRKGFGTVLLEHAVAYAEESPSFDYGEDGFSYQLRTELATLS